MDTASKGGNVPLPEEEAPLDTQRGRRVSLWERLKWELRFSYPLFSLEEPPNNQQQTMMIDVKQSFAGRLRPLFISMPLRFLMTAWSLHVLYRDVSTYPPHNLHIYMGYLTHWGHFLVNLYFVSSFFCSIFVSSSSASSSPRRRRRLVNWTWALYSTVAPLEICITLLYWTAVADSGPAAYRYVSVMEHGGLAVLVLIDGLVIGLVPVRVKHVMYLYIVCVLYLVWSIIDAAWSIDNGEWGPAYQDDALYPVLNWKENQEQAALVSGIAGTVVAPATFGLCWMLSLASRTGWDGARRPVVAKEEEDNSYATFDQDAVVV